MLTVRRLIVYEILKAIGTSHDSLVLSFNDHLGMEKLSARWVSYLLTNDYKTSRVTTQKECLALLNLNPNEMLRRFIAVDETWIYHKSTEIKHWVYPYESVTKKAEVALSASHVGSFLGCKKEEYSMANMISTHWTDSKII